LQFDAANRLYIGCTHAWRKGHRLKLHHYCVSDHRCHASNSGRKRTRKRDDANELDRYVLSYLTAFPAGWWRNSHEKDEVNAHHGSVDLYQLLFGNCKLYRDCSFWSFFQLRQRTIRAILDNGMFYRGVDYWRINCKV
jgi:hypothetical protein